MGAIMRVGGYCVWYHERVGGYCVCYHEGRWVLCVVS